MEKEKREKGQEEYGAMAIDMEFARPDKANSFCPKCIYRKPDSIIKINEERTVVIEQWCSAECDKYTNKPSEVIWDNANCEYFKADEKVLL